MPLNSKSTYFSNLAKGPFYSYKEIEIETSVPDNCKYNQNDVNIISILTIDKLLNISDIFI